MAEFLFRKTWIGSRLSQLRIPIRTKITLPYLFLSVLLAIAAGFAISRVVLDTLEERFKNQLAEVGILSSELMVAEEDRLLENLRLLANSQGVADVLLARNPDELRSLTFGVVVNNQIEAVEFLDVDGNPVIALRHKTGSNIEDYAFSAGGNGEIFRSWDIVSMVLQNQEDPLGDKYSGPVQAEWGNYFYVSGPVYNEKGNFAGVILVGTKLQTIVNTLREKTLGQITFYRFDGEPIVTSFPTMPEVIESDTAFVVLADQDLPKSKTRDLQNSQRDLSILALDYTEALGAWEIRGDVDIGIMGSALQKNFFANPSSLTSVQLGMIISLALFLVIIIGMSLADLITRPLLGLVKVTEAVANGDLNANVDLETNDEIRTLAESFNQMIANLNQSRSDLLEAYDSALFGWSKALELRDKETEGHTQRVMEVSLALAHELGLSEEEQVHIRRGAILHDIGKMGVPDAILHKPGPLTEEEWVIMRKHPAYAFDMLKGLRFLETALDIPRYHHENWDGKGYPYGLKGEEIPLAARIFAVVDVWDALTCERPYKRKFTATESMAILEVEAGAKLDPQIVQAFKKFMRQYLEHP